MNSLALSRDKENLKSTLDGLLDMLQSLATQPLPDNLQVDISKTIQSLKALPDFFAADTEQMRLAALYNVSHTLGTTLNLDEVLTQAMDAVISLSRAERGFLMLLDQDTFDLRLRAARNFEQETLQRRDAVSRTVIDTVMKGGSAIITTDAQTDPRFATQNSVIIHSLRSIMCAPLRARGQIIGVIYVDNRVQTGIFTNEDLDLLSAFAAQAAIAIENARLYARTDQALNARLGELETLSQIDRELNSQLEFEHVIELTHNWAIKGTNATHGWIALHDEETGKLNVASGPAKEFPKNVEIPDITQEPPYQIKEPASGHPARLVAPISHSGKLMGAIVVHRPLAFTDTDAQFISRLSARAANAIENARLYQAVQLANQEKTKFVSVVSHELRIPMTSIKGYADLIRQGAVGPVNEQQVNFLNTIHNNVERMSKLVSDLSDISRIETGRLKLEMDNVTIDTLVEETIRSLQPRFDEKNQKLEVKLAKNLPQVYADPDRLGQILTNLVSNANKYTPADGKIRINASVVKKTVRIDVIDTGIGISQEDQKSLFSQFFRSEDTAVREQQGWGLGLNVTKRLVELMGGEIGVESEFGKGSTFWFSLPTATDEKVAQKPE